MIVDELYDSAIRKECKEWHGERSAQPLKCAAVLETYFADSNGKWCRRRGTSAGKAEKQHSIQMLDHICRNARKKDS
jgi:hypothetical protein